MSTAGYNTVIKRNGTVTAFNAESMTATTLTNQYQIDDTSKEVWDTSVEPTFYEDASAIPSSDIENINYLFGKVTFSTEKTGAITVDGEYFPTQTISYGREYTLDQSVNLEDASNYDDAQSNNGYRTYVSTLWDINASITRLISDLTEADILFNIWENGDPIIIEIQPGGADNPIFRGYMIMESNNVNGEVDSLEEEQISLVLNDNGNGVGFGWSDF